MALLLIFFELLVVVGTSLVFWRVALRRSPRGILLDGAKRILLDPQYRIAMLWVIAVIVFDVIETQFDDRIRAALGYDLTSWLYWLEGDLAAGPNSFRWLPAVWSFTFIYIILLPVLLASPIVLAAAEGDFPMFKAASLGIVINYVAALPFYFFFPVREMWSGNPEKVRLLMDLASPAIMEAYRSSSALDNCFPSLHTSLALTAAIVASRRGPRAYAVLLWAAAALVVASTIYLGIHWALDAAAGILLAALAARLAIRLAAQEPEK